MQQAPKTQANDLCRAVQPDGGIAFQKYNPRTKRWGWVYVGAAYYAERKFTKAAVLYQLKPSRFDCESWKGYSMGWYRYVLVSWARRKGGWRARVHKSSPAVYWPGQNKIKKAG